MKCHTNNFHLGSLWVNKYRLSGTFAHELLAISYAGWISPAFHLKVNQVFIDYRTGALQPAIPQTLPEPLRLAAEAMEERDKLQTGYLEHKVTVVTRTDGSEKTTEQVRVTPKGLAKLATELNRREAA